MIKRIIDSRLPLIIYNPTKVFDKNYFKNIYDTGALPVFDTEFFKLNEVLNKIIELQNEEILFGIRIFTTDKEIIDFLNKNNIINLSLVVLSYFDKSELDDISLTNTFYKCFIETIDVDINDKLDKFSPHGLILKGNEAPGKVSKYTSFILMQWYLENSEFPVFIHGGVGQYTAAGIFAAGANGIVLDNQLFLSEEAPLSKEYKNVIANVEEKDTIVLGENLKNRFRVFSKLGTIITKTIKKHETDCILNQSDDNTYEQISKNIVGINTSNNQPVQSLFYLGQDTIFAKQFIQKSQKLKEIIYYFFKTIGECLEAVDEHDPMTAYSPLAKEHHTKYPIIQGPMANISDNIEFAEEIKKNGGLPFFALGNLPKDIVETLITNACQKTENFGVGLIGTETHRKCLDDHFTVIKKYKIPYALIAGGNASDVEKFEMFGIKTYIHTPSSQLLELALNYKATKIILEGTEAGGHVGNLTSFVLWENSINKILQEYKSLLNDISIIFAGGINSQIGSYFVSGLTSHLSQKGIKIGISVGTSYLFTDEAVETKALKNIYQNLGLTNKETIVIGSSVSLNTRTLFTNFSKNVFKKELERNKINLSKEERKHLFESDNGNALLIAAKAFYVEGFDEEKQTYLYKNCSEEEQQARGNFMFGDSVIQFPKTIRIEDLHSSLFATKINLTNNLNRLEILTSEDKTINDEIAIIGIGCKFPDAQNPEEYWKNIISKKYSIKVIPKERYNWDLFYESDKNVEDKNYSKLAACIDDFEFNFEKFGYSENEAKNISRGQQLLLEAAAMAVEDAGYNHENLPKDKTVVIIGDCTGPEFCDRHFKHSFPEIKYHLEQITTFNQLNEETKNRTIAKIKEAYDLPFNYKLDNVINNIEASLIAKYFGLESNNYSVDAACASSFVAIDCAVKSLMNGNSDCAIVGGVNTNFSPEIYLGFAKMGALSDDGSFPLDERANGFVIGEGAGIVVLKRLKDAIRDKDNIQGIIKGIGTSSDGKGKIAECTKCKWTNFSY